jgi:hypothetical protein
MLQSVPSRAQAKPRLLVQGLKCPTPITIQVVGPNTLYLAESDTALMQTDDSGVLDALQINQASGIVVFWAMGDVWAAGSQAANAAFKPLIYIPNTNTGSTTNPAGGSL